MILKQRVNAVRSLDTIVIFIELVQLDNEVQIGKTRIFIALYFRK